MLKGLDKSRSLSSCSQYNPQLSTTRLSSLRTSMHREDSTNSYTVVSLENSSPAIESRVSHLFTPILMTPSILTPSKQTPPEMAVRRKRKPLPPSKEMRRRWSKSNERYLPSIDVADIPRYENENAIIKSEDVDEEEPYQLQTECKNRQFAPEYSQSAYLMMLEQDVAIGDYFE